MGPDAGTPPGRFWRLLLLFAALDTLAVALWAVLFPRALFALLGVVERTDAWAWQLLQKDLPPPRDAGLWHLLGLIDLDDLLDPAAEVS